MAESNESWGYLAAHDSEMAEAWDGYSLLPEPGERDALDALCRNKGISINALVRQGARLSDHNVLAFAYQGGIKYRDLVTGRRWNYHGSDFLDHGALKIVAAGSVPAESVIVTESETDAAWLSDCYPSDIAILPSGAKHFTAKYADQLQGYKQVLVGLDNDDAGEIGAAKIAELVAHAQRFAPPADVNDWCEIGPDRAPELPAVLEQAQVPDIVFGAQLMELEVPDTISYFEHALLPVGGQLMFHGWTKSFKSFMALDMMSALATGSDWCCFEPTEEPVKVCVIQWEIVWPYFKQRIETMREQCGQKDLWDENFGVWQPMRRPVLTPGDKASEDALLRPLVANGVQVVLVDPIRRAGRGADFNSEQEVSRLLGFFQRVQDHGISVVAIHHDVKQGRTGQPDIGNMTGSGAFAGDADTLVSVYLPQGDQLNDARRNLMFTFRNAPAIGNRGFTMEDERIIYSPSALEAGETPSDSPLDQPDI